MSLNTFWYDKAKRSKKPDGLPQHWVIYRYSRVNTLLNVYEAESHQLIDDFRACQLDGLGGDIKIRRWARTGTTCPKCHAVRSAFIEEYGLQHFYHQGED